MLEPQKDDNLKTIGGRIRHERRKAGMTMGELSIQTGLSVSMVSEIERGKTIPGFAILTKIAESLDVKAGHLRGRNNMFIDYLKR